MLRAALVIAVHNLRRNLRDRSFLFLGVVTPVVMAALIGMAFGGMSSFSARIAVVDADGSALTGALTEGLVTSIPAGEPLTVTKVTDVADARARIERGELDAAVVVPAGFGAAVTGTDPRAAIPPLEVVTDVDHQIAGDIARSLADGIAARLDAVRLAVATAIAGGVSPSDLTRLVGDAEQLRIPLEVAREDVGRAYQPSAYFGASMGILFLFFTLGSSARGLLQEKEDGTLARMRAAPIDQRAILVGKALSMVVLGFASLCIVWLVTTVAFSASWGNPLAVVAIIAGIVIAVAGIGALVTGFCHSNAQANAMTSLVAFVLALLGGSFQQAGSLPPLFERLSLLTPNGWALRSFVRVGAVGATLADVAPAVVLLVGIGAVTLLGASLRLRRSMLG